MQQSHVNSENWTFCHYASSTSKAVITFGASAESDFEYHVTIVDEDNLELFQKTFDNLDLACKYLNSRYNKIWNFIDATAKATASDSGCSTCVAH